MKSEYERNYRFTRIHKDVILSAAKDDKSLQIPACSFTDPLLSERCRL
jgi:hypothetical protein